LASFLKRDWNIHEKKPRTALLSEPHRIKNVVAPSIKTVATNDSNFGAQGITTGCMLKRAAAREMGKRICEGH
jgi:hypothetical protein